LTDTLRFNPETMPRVTVTPRSSGKPIAYTVSASSRSLDRPSVTGVSRVPSTFTTAMSCCGSVPITVPDIVGCPSVKTTRTCTAPSTTWLFVTMTPSEEAITPVPSAFVSPT
jgi:hypothetical protein